MSSMNQRRIVARSPSEFDPDFGRYATVIANLLRYGECPRGEGSCPVSFPPPFPWFSTSSPALADDPEPQGSCGSGADSREPHPLM